MSDFIRIKTLGEGSYGKVILVYRKENRTFYGMKVISKETAVQLKVAKRIILEKKLLYSMNWQFIVKMVFHFKDNASVYLVMEYIQGGDMFSRIKAVGKLSESDAQFYAAQLILGLQYLHYLDIIHRDLKTENVMIDSQGYLKIIDFGLCKYSQEIMYTFCRTPEYMAPEIILDGGYYFSVDWWAFGILLYEMVAGKSPFHNLPTIKIYEKVLAGAIKYPSYFSPTLKRLLKHLLQVDPTRRYGSLKRGIDGIKLNAWFSSTNWKDIYRQKVKPPFIPEVQGPADTSNFEIFKEEQMEVSSVNKFEEEFAEF